MRPLVAGDVVSTSGQQRVDRGDLPPQLRQMLNAPAYALQEVRLAVVSTAPKGIVQITPETEIELRPEYEEPKEARRADRSEEHTYELQSLMRISYAVLRLKKK